MLTVEVLKSDKALTTICECLPMALREAWKRVCNNVGIEYAEATFAKGEPV